MHRPSRPARFVSLLIVASAAAAIPVGCAEGTAIEVDSLPTEEAADAARDAKPRTSTSDAASETPDDASAEPEEPELDASTKADASSKGDASSKSDAGNDASSGSDGGTDGGADAGLDAAANGGGEVDDDAGSAAPKPTQGEVVISEVMFDPSGTEPAAEWIEIYNAAPSTRTLSGLVIRDGSNRSHAIASGVVIAPGAYAVLASERAAVVLGKVPDAVILYAYNEGAGTSVQLANSANGGVALLDGSTEIARAHYGLLGMSSSTNGQSIQLKVLDYASAGAKASWCYSSTAWAAGSGKGTPGAASDCAP